MNTYISLFVNVCMYVLDNGYICVYVCMYCMYLCLNVRYNVHILISVYLFVCLFACMYSLILSDPNLRADQVGVPVLVAKVVTFPEKVSLIRCIFIHTFKYKYTQIHIHTCTYIHSHMLS
jgi:hypothetical protein